LREFDAVFRDTVLAIISIQASSCACERVFSDAAVILAGRPGLPLAVLEETIRQRKSVRSEHASVDSYCKFLTSQSLEVVRSRQ